MTEWEEQISSVNDAYLIINSRTAELVGIIEADDGRHDMEIALKMGQLGYAILRLNFDDLVDGARKFKNKMQVERATKQLMEGLE